MLLTILRRFSTTAIVVGAISLAASLPAKATTFFNGSFESPGLGNGLGTPGTLIPTVEYVGDTAFGDGSWTHVGPTPDPNLYRGDFYTNGDGETAFQLLPQHGFVYFGFGAAGVTGGSLSQTFDTIVGQTYLVTYWLTVQEFIESSPGELPPEQLASVEVLDSSNLMLASLVNSLTQPNGWFRGVDLEFTATTTSTTLRFTDTTLLANSGPVNWGLDNVNVESTPEPGSCALLGLGLGVVALLRKKYRMGSGSV